MSWGLRELAVNETKSTTIAHDSDMSKFHCCFLASQAEESAQPYTIDLNKSYDHRLKYLKRTFFSKIPAFNEKRPQANQ
jgi:hypothetical protein